MCASYQEFPSTSEQGMFSVDLTHTAAGVQMHADLFEHLDLGDQVVQLPWVVVCCCAGLSYEAAMHYSAMINYSPH